MAKTATSGFVPEAAARALAAPPGAAPAEAPPPSLTDIERAGRLAEENEGLAGEVLHIYEQINCIFGFTQQIGLVTDPRAIESKLLDQLSDALQTPEVFLRIDGGEWRPRGGVSADAQQLVTMPSPELESAIERCMRERHVLVCALRGRQVLLGPISRLNQRLDVIAALRGASDPAFNAGDMSFIESMLAFAGQILSNAELHEQISRMSIQVTRALVAAIDKKDRYTSGHSERVGMFTRLTAERLEIPRDDLTVFEWAGLLHDVGKIGVPEEILRKPGKLTDAEFAAIKKHPEMGYEILKPIASLEPVLNGVLYHHENEDGSGYPTGLAGQDIPLVARIVHVVDVFDALSSSRSYRSAFTIDQACDILRKESGTKLNPAVVTAFLAALDAFRTREPERFAALYQTEVEPA